MLSVIPKLVLGQKVCLNVTKVHHDMGVATKGISLKIAVAFSSPHIGP